MPNNINDFEKTAKEAVTKKGLTDVNDLLIIRKIPEVFENKEPVDNHKELDILIDENLLASQHEVNIRRQFNILQAAERGKKALSNEIAEIKKVQEKKAEILNLRRRVIEKERERSRKIAALPPPFPQSIRTLLKEKENKESNQKKMNEKQESEAEFDGLLGIPVSCKRDKSISDSENKENMANPDEIARKKLIDAERDARARKRFNEAIKKTRVQQECAETLKAIENAEQATRRLQAKTVSNKGGTVPCYIPDKLKKGEKQVEMEDAVERVFKNTSKEHVIEDLEGYEDEWEMKYKKIESPLTTKLIDCVPKFVKDNYSYLLEDESLYQCGRHFTGLNESSDELNTAYIESPTESAPDKASSSDEIDAVIIQLDKMRAETNEQYEKEFKPLLEKHKDEKKPTLADKAVETSILKQPTIDKSVENCNIPLQEKTPPTSRSIQVAMSNGGITAFQRKKIGSKFMSQAITNIEESPELKSKYLATEIQKQNSTFENWSSSSYISLPSNHGMPVCIEPKISPNWNVRLAEKQKSHRDYIPLSKAPAPDINLAFNHETGSDDELRIIESEGLGKISPTSELHHLNVENVHKIFSPQSNFQTNEEIDRKSKLSYFVKKVADKYLKNKIEISSPSLSRALQSQAELLSEKPPSPCQEEVGISERDFISFEKEKNAERERSLISNKTPELPSDLESMFERTELNSEFSTEVESTEQSCLTHPKVISGGVESNEPIQQYHFHNLSTIPEMDSVLTNETGPSFTNLSKLSQDQVILNKSSRRKSIEEINISKISLIDPPPSEVPELAKNIKFVEATGASSADSFQSVVSGSLTDLVTPMLSPSLCVSSASGNSEYLGLKTPHLVDSEHSFISSLSAISQKTPYSSSFQDPHRKPPYLTNIESLPRYFEEVSSVRHGKIIKYHGGFEMSPYIANYPETSRHQNQDEKSLQGIKVVSSSESSVGSFEPLPLQSYSSTPTNCSQSNSDESKKVIHKQSTHRNQGEKAVQGIKVISSCESSVGSFEKLPPQSYSTTPTNYSQNGSDEGKNVTSTSSKSREKMRALNSNNSTSASLDSLKSGAPFSYLPSPSLIKSSPSDTMHEHISLPLKFVQNKVSSYSSDSKNDTVDVIVDSVESFKNLTPKSYFSGNCISQISNPSITPRPLEGKFQTLKNPPRSEMYHSCKKVLTEDSSTILPQKFYENQPSSSEGRKFECLTPHSDISSLVENIANDVPSSRIFNIHYKTPTSVLMKQPVTLRLDFTSPNSPQYKVLVDDPNDQDSYTKVKCYKANTKRLSPELVDKSSNFEAKKCSSDFFTPNLVEADFPKEHVSKKSNPDYSKNDIQNPGSEAGFPSNILCEKKQIKAKSCSSDYFIPQIDKRDIVNFKKPDIPKQNNSKTSVESRKLFLNKIDFHSSKHNKVINMQDKNNDDAQVQMPPLIGSSNSSSSLFSASKINFQSTPLKTLDEITREPGILEESELTLMKSDLTLKPESPKKKKISSHHIPCKTNTLIETFPDPSHCITPITVASIPESHCFDSPSLLSFMQHEMSCCMPKTPDELDIITPKSSPKKTPKSIEKKGGLATTKKTPGKEYKIRTKRLWSNLEEVKSRKLIEERKEQMIKNRLKMKAYSKKIATPRGKPN